jgi:TRAP-type uncharacterized transport system substrate-binding protein
MRRSNLSLVGIAAFLSFVANTTPSPAAMQRSQSGSNPGVVVLETEGSAGVSVRMAEELARATNDGTARRVLPVIGVGSLQNALDLRLLPSIDVAILQTDVLAYVKQQKLAPGIESWMTYISKLSNEEFHLIARAEIKSISDLANHDVSVDVSGAGTEITAARLFDLLRIPVHTVNYDPEQALEKLRSGEIAAVALVAGKPAPLFCELIGENGLHFLSIPLDPAANAGYLPARLTAADYPGLIPFNQPIDTFAVGTVLAVANLPAGSERYRNVSNFVEAFFSGFQSLLQPGRHPKWHEVDLTRELPGWRRFPPAAQWLKRNAQIATAPNVEELKSDFARFIEERQQASGGPPLSQQEKDRLFDQFKDWASERSGLWQRVPPH